MIIPQPLTRTRAQSDLPAILLSLLTKGPASTGMLMGMCMTTYSWIPLRQEVLDAMRELVAKRKAEWCDSGCWRVGSGVLPVKKTTDRGMAKDGLRVNGEGT